MCALEHLQSSLIMSVFIEWWRDIKLRLLTSNTSDAEVDSRAPFTHNGAEGLFIKYRCFFDTSSIRVDMFSMAKYDRAGRLCYLFIYFGAFIQSYHNFSTLHESEFRPDTDDDIVDLSGYVAYMDRDKLVPLTGHPQHGSRCQ